MAGVYGSDWVSDQESNFFRLSPTAFVGGSISGGFFTPSSINCDCPACGRAANFNFSGAKLDTSFWLVTHQIKCSGCAEKIKFFGNYSQTEENDRHSLSLFIFTNQTSYIKALDFSKSISDKLNRSFISAVDSFNSGNYHASTVMGRRTLEGLFKSLVSKPERHSNLNRLIDAVAKERDLSEPLRRLSHAVRDGGNLGAHFDLDREPDAQVAKMLVFLVQYLIEFLHVLPSNIEELERALDKDVSYENC